MLFQSPRFQSNIRLTLASENSPAIRFGATLPDNVREVAICTVGLYYRARFEFAAHYAIALKAGVSAEKLDRLRDGEVPGFEHGEAIAWRVATALLEDHRLDDALYGQALAALGEEQLIELVQTIGYYCLVSHTLNAFDVPLNEGMPDPWPQR